MSKRRCKRNARDGKGAGKAEHVKVPAPSEAKNDLTRSASTPQLTDGSAEPEKPPTPSEAKDGVTQSASTPQQTGGSAEPEKPQTPSEAKNGVTQSASTPQQTGGSAEPEKPQTPDYPAVANDYMQLKPELKTLVNKLLKEGATFEDVVEAVDERDDQRITLNAVKSYFQGSRMLQTQRARRQVEDAEALLEALDKDPRSAEARLARASLMTGYAKVNRKASVVSPREAARYRMECENLNLKHQILMMTKKKAKQDLECSIARTNLIKATGIKLQQEVELLGHRLEAHRPGDPIGSDILQKVQQLYGLVRQPLIYEEIADAQIEARQLAK
jgi:hypothetical protein